ncbi:MAG: isoprenylcysteine carboxylmethyltransferase family protein [Sedimentisphaerales bacterium]|nr:isoprenylcysteine carboxylmethyltransferase family protein [Sedimentisphaerales bacterium]
MNKINYFGFKGIFREVSFALLNLLLLLISAGSVKWINAWVYIGFNVLFHILGGAYLAKVNPRMLNERGKLIQGNTQSFDKVWVVFYILLVSTASCIAGLDAVRFEWSHMPPELIIIVAIIYISAHLLLLWAMAVNPHFETTVRIQEERNHQVCISGPYKFIRHPGYVSFSAIIVSSSFILGSWWANLPNGMILILLVIRTAFEDKFLQKELKGYKEYAQKTKYKLIPFLW